MTPKEFIFSLSFLFKTYVVFFYIFYKPFVVSIDCRQLRDNPCDEINTKDITERANHKPGSNTLGTDSRLRLKATYT